MNHPNHRYPSLIAFVLFLAGCVVMLGSARAQATQDDPAYDLVVYGGTSAGVTAALQAKRLGRSVVLIEPGQHLGGLTAGGLGATDIGNKAAIGGLSREFYRRIGKHYADDAAWRWQAPLDYRKARPVEPDQAMWTFEPHVAERILRGMLSEHGIAVVFGERLDLAKGVSKVAARMQSIRMESGRRFVGKMFLDATYEGDLMALAGVAYTVGREANATYGETLNGVQIKNAVHHQFVVPVDPYVVAGDATSGLLPGITKQALPADGSADGSADTGVQAYCFRMCTTDVPANLVAWQQPVDYDEQLYELLFRNFEAGDLRIPWHPIWMPNRKTDTNNNFAVSTDFIGHNYAWADADYATRERIFAHHLSYQQGLLWALANHPRVPEKVREYFQRFGLAKDEFVDHGHWPHQLYVREARRMVSDYVMSQHDCQGRRQITDGVGLAAYTMDSHNIQRYVDAQGHVRNEGDVQVGGFPPYAIAYRSIRPSKAQCENLLVPVCLSASHIAYGSIRMEPVFMVLGQSAATAACQAIAQDVAVQDIDIEKLQAQLLADGQVLHWQGSPGKPGISLQSLPGIVLDDRDATCTGDWVQSDATPGYIGAGYLHDGNGAKGQRTAAFVPVLPKAGQYQVGLAYTSHANRASKVKVTVTHAGGSTVVLVDQTKKPDQGVFHRLGTFACSAGKQASVTITTADSDGYVVVDAVQFLLVE